MAVRIPQPIFFVLLIKILIDKKQIFAQGCRNNLVFRIFLSNKNNLLIFGSHLSTWNLGEILSGGNLTHHLRRFVVVLPVITYLLNN